MKKLLSILISAAMLTSLLTVPAFADYEKADFDQEKVNLTFDDGTETGPDGSKAKKVTTEETIFTLTDTNFESPFFLSMDVRYDSATDFTTNVTINNNSNVGPQLQYAGGQLVNITGSNNGHVKLGAISTDTWYSFELEGKMRVEGAKVELRVYSYTGSARSAEPIITISDLGLRNFYAGSNNKNPDRLKVTNVTIDNVKYVSLKPDRLNITSTKDELNAGESAVMSAKLYRGDVDYGNPTASLTWSLENAGSGVTMSESGILATTRNAANQTVTVKVTDGTVEGSKEIEIHGVDTTNEPFDNLTLTGDDTIEVGGSGTITAQVFKDGADVTDALNENQFVWSLYTPDGVYKNENKAIEIVSNGKTATINVADSVLPQKLNIRLSTPTGFVYDEKAIDIEWAEEPAEKVIYYNAFEDSAEGFSRVESIDGSLAYTTANKYIDFGQHSEYTVTEFDVRFAEDNSYVYLVRNDGGGQLNSSFHLRGGTLTSQSSSSNYPSYAGITGVTTDDWLHIEVLYRPDDASCLVSKYDADGNLGEPVKFEDITRRNGGNYGAFHIHGAVVDNLKISVAAPNEIAISSSVDKIFSGDSVQFDAVVSRKGLPFKSTDGLTWKVLNSNGKEFVGDNAPVKISDSGELTTSIAATTQDVTVVLASATKEVRKTIHIEEKIIFEVTNIGVNPERNKIVRLYVNKNYEYDDSILFLVALYDDTNHLIEVGRRSQFGDSMIIGANEIPFDFTLPEGFDPETGSIRVYTWTRF